MNIEEDIAVLRGHLVDHNYFQVIGNPIVQDEEQAEHRDNIEEQIAVFQDHLIDHNYFQVEDNPRVQEEDEENPIVQEEEDEENPIVQEEEDDANIAVPQTYTLIPGVHHGSRIVLDNLGYRYYKRNARRNRRALKCVEQSHQRRCFATATVNLDQLDNRIRLLRQHNHQPRDLDVNIPFLRETIGAQGISPIVATSSIRTLYNNNIVEHPAAAFNYTFLQAQERVKKMRRLRLPGRPRNIHHLAELLNEHRNVNYAQTVQNPPSRFYQQELMVNGTSVGVIFANMDGIDKYREELATVTVVGIDGTFKTLPRVPADLKCFLTIQVVFKSVSFPMVYVLLSSMTEEVYSALFEIVRNILPLNYHLVSFITDYERALFQAIQRTFPESRSRCCWFHFTQSIVRYCHRKMNKVLDLVKSNAVAAQVLRMVLALPHLPAAVGDPRCPQFSMYLGYRAILFYISQFPEIEMGMRNFLVGYIHDYWFLQVGPHLISIFGEEYRTNNYLESFHSTLLVQMSKHPNIWQFLLRARYQSNADAQQTDISFYKTATT